jgi:hypothetical protein
VTSKRMSGTTAAAPPFCGAPPPDPGVVGSA